MCSFRMLYPDSPWMIGGDFNAICCLDEYSGRSTPNPGSMEDFNCCIEQCALVELQTVGGEFTWGGTRNTWWVSKKLDRRLFSTEWMQLFPVSSVHLLNKTSSDHCPLLHQFEKMVEPKPKMFRFQNMWLRRENFIPFVHSSWNKPVDYDGMFGFSIN